MDWLTIFGRVLLGVAVCGVAGIFAYLYWREKKDARGLVEYYKKREEIEHLGEEGGDNGDCE